MFLNYYWSKANLVVQGKSEANKFLLGAFVHPMVTYLVIRCLNRNIRITPYMGAFVWNITVTYVLKSEFNYHFWKNKFNFYNIKFHDTLMSFITTGVCG